MASNPDVHPPKRPLGILLVAGPKDHGPGEHDYPRWQAAWSAALGAAPDVSVETAFVWPTAAQWRQNELAVFYLRNRDWSDAQYRDLERYLGQGTGIAMLHCAMVSSEDPSRLAGLIGISGRRPQLQFRHGAVQLDLDSRHGIVAGAQRLTLEDEAYWELTAPANGVEVLATSVEAGAAKPQMWTFQRGLGRVFGSVPGHYMTTFDLPEYRQLLARGLAWAARVSPVQFAGIVDSPRVAVGN
ncbi:MAG: ThuA domain-containing protein [Pirellulales bacterium]